jgi:hypothetical protein
MRRTQDSAAARVRGEGENFVGCFDELKGLVGEACDQRGGWEAKVVAGIQAIVAFAADSPAKALALTVEARRPDHQGAIPADQVIAYFAKRYGEVAPSTNRALVSTDESIIEAIALIIRGHLLAGTAEQLPEASPDLVYLALLPYLGLAETRGWAQALTLQGISE